MTYLSKMINLTYKNFNIAMDNMLQNKIIFNALILVFLLFIIELVIEWKNLNKKSQQTGLKN
jgi:hypothetical protein